MQPIPQPITFYIRHTLAATHLTAAIARPALATRVAPLGIVGAEWHTLPAWQHLKKTPDARTALRAV